jgi:dipeptidyl aminopeptidase/acylaminoacyl peptidase
VWITGGDCNSIGDVWTPQPVENDQSASVYRRAGIVMMYPSLRGGNQNPGLKEGFLGEVDDVIAAATALAKVPYVDATRIYLGGHSTGGTLALLTSECSSLFRGVFSFGPVYDVAGYGADSGFLPFNYTDQKEVAIRSPGYWLADVKKPTWVIEGASGTSNYQSLREMAAANRNRQVHFIPVPGADHFSVLYVANVVIAKKILADGPKSKGITLTQNEIAKYFR